MYLAVLYKTPQALCLPFGNAPASGICTRYWLAAIFSHLFLGTAEAKSYRIFRGVISFELRDCIVRNAIEANQRNMLYSTRKSCSMLMFMD